jgi:hypothetical protein
MTGQRLVDLVVILSPNKSAPWLITTASIDQDHSDARVNRYEFTAVCRSPDRRQERVGQASSDPLLGLVMHFAAENRQEPVRLGRVDEGPTPGERIGGRTKETAQSQRSVFPQR